MQEAVNDTSQSHQTGHGNDQGNNPQPSGRQTARTVRPQKKISPDQGQAQGPLPYQKGPHQQSIRRPAALRLHGPERQ